MPRLFAALLGTLLLSSGCTFTPTAEQRTQLAAQLAQSHGWQSLQLRAGIFDLQSYVAEVHPAISGQLTIYLEGDGLAWISSRHPSTDPTPVTPLALRLALAQPNGAAAYLGRPCQYLGTNRPPCERRYWTGARFAEEVVAGMDQAISQLKTRTDAHRLTLVGYSGGGGLALLLATRRRDVERVITVAGNLDHSAWTRHHRVTPMQGSLNPADLRGRLIGVEQLHLVGEKDRIMPPELVEAFVADFPPGTNARVRLMPGFDHSCCWAENWAQIWTRQVSQD